MFLTGGLQWVEREEKRETLRPKGSSRDGLH